MKRISIRAAFVILFALFSAMGACKTYAQLYNGFSINAGYGILRYGWNKPDEYLARMYREPFFIRDLMLGASMEFFRNKFQSVIASAGYKIRVLDFDYDKKNASGVVTGTNTLSCRIHTFQFSLSERLRYHFAHLFIFFYAGMRLDLNFDAYAEDPDFNTFTNGIKKTTYGLTTGAGIGFEFRKILNITAEAYYEPDFTKAYTSSTGYLKNSEVGVRLCFWLLKKSKKK